MTTSPHIELTVDALVLHGVNPREGDVFATAFTRELTRLLSDDGLPADLSQESRPIAISFAESSGEMTDTGPDLSPDALGDRAAAAVYTGLGGPTR